MAVQLPRNACGPLCRHTTPGRCTWWCSYRRGVLSIGTVLGLLAVGTVLLLLWGDDGGRQRAMEAVAGVGLVSAVGVPLVIGLSRRDEI